MRFLLLFLVLMTAQLSFAGAGAGRESGGGDVWELRNAALIEQYRRMDREDLIYQAKIMMQAPERYSSNELRSIEFVLREKGISINSGDLFRRPEKRESYRRISREIEETDSIGDTFQVKEVVYSQKQ